MNTCYIALGSNMESPLTQVVEAVSEISTLGNITAQSSWYKSEAIGPGFQDDYINGVICLETLLEPHQLLSALQAIENKHGRKRTIRWGPRTLDLDILLFNQQELHTPELVIPHPHMKERNFVIYPLSEIAPDLQLGNNQSLRDIKIQLDEQGLDKLV